MPNVIGPGRDHRPSETSSGAVRNVPLMPAVARAVAAMESSARSKGVLVAVRTTMESVEVADFPEDGHHSIQALLSFALARSPHRGVVTVDVQMDPRTVTLVVMDQGPAPTGSGTEARGFEHLWSAHFGTAHGIHFPAPLGGPSRRQ